MKIGYCSGTPRKGSGELGDADRTDVRDRACGRRASLHHLAAYIPYADGPRQNRMDKGIRGLRETVRAADPYFRVAARQ